MAFFTNILTNILAALFPDRCVGCAARGCLLCGTCRMTLLPAEGAPHSFVMSVYSYRDPRVRRLIKLLKYKNARHAAGAFGPALASALTEFLGEEALFIGSGDVVLVPIPLSKKRMRMRGFNQSELLAEALKSQMGVSVRIDTKMLQRHADTIPQADIRDKRVRLRNLGDCFSVSPKRTPSGEVVILIDDVATTGTTLRTARACLQKAGYAKVYAVTAAR